MTTAKRAIFESLLAIPLALLTCTTYGADMKPESTLARTADEILARRTSDGAIVLGKACDAEHRIIPYFSTFAAYGLVVAFRETRDKRYLDAARRWADWYAAHQDKDGTVQDYTGAPGAWKATGHYDSTDSYAGTYLELLLTIQRASPDLAWLRKRFPSVLGAVDAIRLTLQPNGLTTATPTWPVMYTMDATETMRGLRSAAEIARLLDDPKHANEFDKMAGRMQAAISQELWNAKEQYYRVGIQTDGGKMEGLEKWYPDVMAQLMAIGWLPPSDRNRALFARLKARFADHLPTSVHTEDDLDRLVWWGIAARGAGDREMSKRILSALSGSDLGTEAFHNPAFLGHICRLLAEH